MHDLRCLIVYLLHFSLQHFKLLIEQLHVKGEGIVKNAMKESFKILNEVCASLCSNHSNCWVLTIYTALLAMEINRACA